MKVFISWSGNRSRAVAELLNDWIKCVIQATRPWISSRDIESGALWFSEIADQLKDTAVGIVCITQENKNAPWILFEAGALTKGLSKNRVCTFLVDLQPRDLSDPLAQFNHTSPNRDGLWGLVRTLNNCLSENSLDERILNQIFSVYWEQFEFGFKEALAKHLPSQEAEPRKDEDILAEILQTTRSMGSRLSQLEKITEISFLESSTKRHMNRESSMMHRLRDIIESEVSPEKAVEYCNKNGIPLEVFEREYQRYSMRRHGKSV